jgi:methyl-accepting chemotaxis protein
MKGKHSASLVMLAIAAVTSAISTYIYYSSLVRTVSLAQQREMNTVSNLIQDDLNNQAGRMAALSSLIAHLPGVQAALQTSNSAELKNQLSSAITLQHDAYGLRDAEFYTPPATVLYSFYSNKQEGTDVSGYREMVLAANQKNKPQQGVEVGKYGLSIRGITPIKDSKDTTIASFEVSTDFSPILHDVKRVTGFDAAVFVDKKIIDTVATELPKGSADHTIGSFQNTDSTQWELIQPVTDGHRLAVLNEVDQRIVQADDQDYGVVLTPLRDYKGDKIGALVAVKNFSEYQSALKTGLIESIIFGIFQMVFLSGALLIIINGSFLNPIRKINDYVRHMLDGQKEIDSSSLPKSGNEIGDLGKNVEELHQKMNETQESQSTLNHGA